MSGTPPSAAPTLETERLILRQFCRADLDDFAATLGNPEVMRHIGAEPLSREESWRRLLIGPGLWSLTGLGTWAVERREDGRVIGHVGFFDFEREMTPSIIGEPEMGWIFHTDGHGKGYAREAGEAALRWFESTHTPMSIPAIIAPANAPSMRLAERLGFERQSDASYKDEPIALFRRPPWSPATATAAATTTA